MSESFDWQAYLKQQEEEKAGRKKPKRKIFNIPGQKVDVFVPELSQLPPEPKLGRPPKDSTRGASVPTDLTGAQIIGQPPAKPEDQVVHNEGKKKK